MFLTHTHVPVFRVTHLQSYGFASIEKHSCAMKIGRVVPRTSKSLNYHLRINSQSHTEPVQAHGVSFRDL
jgi:hypothetical protein